MIKCGSGRIINICSIQSMQGGNGVSAYAASKHAVAGITNRIPLGRWGQPSDLVGPAVFLASDASAYVNGHLLVVDGGFINC